MVYKSIENYYSFMIQLNSCAAEGLEAEIYRISLDRLNFLLLPASALDLSIFSMQNQKQIGKISVRFNLGWLKDNHIFFKDAHYILVTQYRQMLFLPFLTRKYPDITIFATNLAFELGRIMVEKTWQTIKQFNATRDSLNYHEQSKVLDQYENRFNLSFQNWGEIYSREQIEQAFQKITKVNLHQQYNTERGAVVKPYPSGRSNGSCLWEVESVIRKEKVLLVSEVSVHRWRACRSFQLDRIKESHARNPYKHVIFTKSTLRNIEQGANEELRLAELIKKINAGAHERKSQVIVLSDYSVGVDIVRQLSVKPLSKFEAVMFSSSVLDSMHNYVNTYADYLSEQYRKNLFSKDPDNPLSHYFSLKKEGKIQVGPLGQVAVNRRLPINEVLLQSNPFVYFVQDYQHQLNIADLHYYEKGLIKYDKTHLTLGSTFNPTLLSEMMAALKSAEFFAFSKKSFEMMGQISILEVGRPYNLKQDSAGTIYYTALNFKDKKYQHFKLQRNELELTQQSKGMQLVPRDFLFQISKRLLQRGAVVLNSNKRMLETENTQIELSVGFKLSVSSRSIEEVGVVEEVIRGLGVKYQW